MNDGMTSQSRTNLIGRLEQAIPFLPPGPVELETKASDACTEASKLRLPIHEVVLETYVVDSWGNS